MQASPLARQAILIRPAGYLTLLPAAALPVRLTSAMIV